MQGSGKKSLARSRGSLNHHRYRGCGNRAGDAQDPSHTEVFTGKFFQREQRTFTLYAAVMAYLSASIDAELDK
jgi:hypothetical protein